MGILYDARKIKAYEGMQALAEYTKLDKAFIERLWLEMVCDEGLMKEFMYYLDNHTFLDEYKCMDYGLTDLYFWQLRKYNVKSDLGKNNEDCNKETLTLLAFADMLELKKDPEKYINQMIFGSGMDMFE